MKNKIVFGAFILLFCSKIFAEGIIVDSRFDSIGSTYNEAGLAAGGKNSSSFQGARLRLLFQSKVNDELSGKIRLNLLSASDAPNSEAKFSKYVDYAFLSHQLNSNVYFNAGKVIALIGGREAMVNPGDYYFTSISGGEILSRPLTSLWPVGAILGGQFEDQKIELLVANTTSDDTTGQSRNMIGLSYLGSFLEKKLQPILSFHTDAESENTEKRTYLSVGSKIMLSDFDLDLDYLVNQKNYKVWIANSSKELSSIVVSLRYKYSQAFQIIFKGDLSSDKISTSPGATPSFDEVKYNQVGISTEYYPYSDTKFRYHLAFSNKTTKGSVGDSQSEQKIIAGLRLVHDFLK